MDVKQEKLEFEVKQEPGISVEGNALDSEFYDSSTAPKQEELWEPDVKEENIYDVNFINEIRGKRKHTALSINDNEVHTCDSGQTRDETELNSGDCRLVKWTDNNHYPAVVRNIGHNGTAEVVFKKDQIKFKTTVSKIQNSYLVRIDDIRDVKQKSGSNCKAEFLNRPTQTAVFKPTSGTRNLLNGRNTNDLQFACNVTTPSSSSDGSKTQTTAPDNTIKGSGTPPSSPQFLFVDTNNMDRNYLPVRRTETSSDLSDKEFFEGNNMDKVQTRPSYPGIILTCKGKNISALKPEGAAASDESDEEMVGGHSHAGLSEEDEPPYDVSVALDPIKVDCQSNHCTSNEESQDKTKKNKKNKNFCLYCNTMVYEFARHVVRNHPKELYVQKIIRTKKGPKRNLLIAGLRKEGNFAHSAEGHVKPVKKPSVSSPRIYKACPYCLGLYARNRLWRHQRLCPNNEGRPVEINPYSVSFAGLEDKYPDLVERVFPRMNFNNAANEVVRTDSLICDYGSKFLEGCDDKDYRVHVCSRKMRELAMILIEMKTIDSSIKNLMQALQPKNFDILIAATIKAAGYDTATSTYRDAHFARNVSTALRECCEIAISNAVKKEPTAEGTSFSDIEAELNTTKKLLKTKFRTQVPREAKEINEISIVSLVSDLKILRDYLVKEGEKADGVLKGNPKCLKSFRTLVETTYLRVLLLCRKRPCNLHYLSIDLYENSEQNLKMCEKFKKTAGLTEAVLLKNFKTVFIEGNRKAIPVFFSPEVQRLVETILKVRNNFISETNRFLLSLSGSEEPTTGGSLLSKYVLLAKCVKRDMVKKRRLRKYLPIICQLFDLTNQEVEELLTVMGHTSGEQRQNYCLPDNVFQTSKIFKHLLLMEKGKGEQLKGKALEEIEVSLELDLESEEDSVNEKDEHTEIVEDFVTEDEKININEEHLQLIKPKKKKGKRRKLKHREIHNWSEEQRVTVADFFKDEIREKVPPKKNQIEELYKTYPNLKLPQKWEKIKVFVQNIYTKKTSVHLKRK